MTDFLNWLIAALRDLDPLLVIVVAGVGMMLETAIFIGLVVPGDTIAIVAAISVNRPALFFALVAALVIGSLLGESFGFMLGRWAGPKVRASRLGQKLGTRNWRIAEHYLGERGGMAVFLSRFLPVMHSLIPLTAGMAGMRYRRFIAWTVAASICWALIVVTIGSSAAVGYEQLAGRVKGAGYIMVALVAALICGLWLLKKWFLRRERRHLGIDDAGDN